MPNQITFKGQPLDLEGVVPAVGASAPDASLLKVGLEAVNLSSFAGSPYVLISVPSLDTSVCDLETRRFNSEIETLDGKVKLLAVSMDLPFAQQRWCVAAAADNVLALSDHREGDFGRSWGLLIKPLRLLARAVFVVDAASVVRYAELVPEMTDQPDYAAALAAVKAL